MVDIDIRKIQLPNGRTFQQQLKHEARRFINILQEEIDSWYNLYSPEIYDRTYGMKNSIFAENLVEIDDTGTELSIKIKYTDEAIHKSLWGGDDANTLMLMNEGYQVQSGWHKDIPNFGYREGGHFLEKAVKRFNEDNYFGIKVIINY